MSSFPGPFDLENLKAYKFNMYEQRYQGWQVDCKMNEGGEEVKITPQTLAEELIQIPIFLSARSSTVTNLVYAEFICQLLELWALRLHTTYWLGKTGLDRVVYTRRAVTMILCKIGTIVLAFMTSRANSRRLRQLSVTPCSALEAVDHTFAIIA